jgi:hypothetical protein
LDPWFSQESRFKGTKDSEVRGFKVSSFSRTMTLRFLENKIHVVRNAGFQDFEFLKILVIRFLRFQVEDSRLSGTMITRIKGF